MNKDEKRMVTNLIRYFSEDNKDAFKTQGMEIAKSFYKNGDCELALYIRGLLCDTHFFTQETNRE